MSYDTDRGNRTMGCLANITHMFEESSDPITVSMYTYSFAGMIPGIENVPSSKRTAWAKDLMIEVCTRAARHIPATIFLTAKDRDEAMATGKLVMRPDTHPAVIHARLAPFRIFIERPDRIGFFNRAERYSGIGAFIGCHLYTWDQTKSMLRPNGPKYYRATGGHHQSMFAGMSPTLEGLMDQWAIRRVAALHPSLRHHLFNSAGSGEYKDGFGDIYDEDYDTKLADAFMIPPLEPASLKLAEMALRKAGIHKTPVPCPNMDTKGNAEHFQLWHDTIVNALSK